MAGTETFGPFDGQPWADQTQWYRFGPTWAPSGVIGTAASSPSAGGLGVSFNGLTPTVAAGRAWVRGAGYELSGGSKTMAAIAANTNASLSRVDRIVLRRDLSAKTVTLVALQGTPAASPTAPALTQVETGQWDVPLIAFTVPPNSGTVITNVVDERAWVDPGGISTPAPFRGSAYTTGGITSGTANVTLVTIPITITGQDVAAGRRIMVHVRGTWGNSSNLRVAPLRDGAAFDPNWQEINPGPGNTSWFWIGTVADATAGSHTITVYFRSISSGSAVSAGPVNAYVELI